MNIRPSSTGFALTARRVLLTAFAVGLGWIASPPLAVSATPSETVAIIGTGRVGAAIGPRLAAKGYKIIYGSRDPKSQTARDLVARSGVNATAMLPAEAARQASAILLAVPWTAAEQAVNSLGDIGGKLVMDATNPVIVDGGHDTPVPLATSGAQMIQGWAPKAHVVKAFNTTNWSILADPSKSSATVTIPLAGDDGASKLHAARIAADLGFAAFDTGPLTNARHVEEMALLYINMLLQNRPDTAEFVLSPRKK